MIIHTHINAHIQSYMLLLRLSKDVNTFTCIFSRTFKWAYINLKRFIKMIIHENTCMYLNLQAIIKIFKRHKHIFMYIYSYVRMCIHKLKIFIQTIYKCVHTFNFTCHYNRKISPRPLMQYSKRWQYIINKYLEYVDLHAIIVIIERYFRPPYAIFPALQQLNGIQRF